jgi:hypothetical protein
MCQILTSVNIITNFTNTIMKLFNNLTLAIKSLCHDIKASKPVTWHILVPGYRHFGTAYQTYLQGSSTTNERTDIFS